MVEASLMPDPEPPWMQRARWGLALASRWQLMVRTVAFSVLLYQMHLLTRWVQVNVPVF